MEGTWYSPNELPDDEKEKADKKEKKDAKDVMKKASLLEWFSGADKEDKAEETSSEETDSVEQISEDQTPEIADSEPNAENDSLLDTELSDEEQTIVAEQLVEGRLDAVEAELEQSLSSDEHGAAIAAAQFLEEVSEQVERSGHLDEAVIVAAADTVAAELPEPEVDGEDTPDDAPEPSARNSVPPPEVPEAVPPTPEKSFTPPPSPAPSANNELGIPPSPSPNSLVSETKTTKEAGDEHGHLRYVLTGGIVGYLIGRRGGRKRAEAKLLPVQKKLEKRVGELETSLIEQEQRIRRIAASRPIEQFEVQKEAALRRIRQEREQRPERDRKLEAHNDRSPEQIGKFTLGLQARAERPKSADTLSTTKLLEAAERIPYLHTNIAELYAQGHIKLDELKEIVQSYLTGKSYEVLLKKALERGVMQHTPTTKRTDSFGSTAQIGELLPPIPSPAASRYSDRPPLVKEHGVAMRMGIATVLTAAVVLVSAVLIIWLLGGL